MFYDAIDVFVKVQMEIGLPNEQGRLQILHIHTNRMRDNKKMASDVDLKVRNVQICIVIVIFDCNSCFVFLRDFLGRRNWRC